MTGVEKWRAEENFDLGKNRRPPTLKLYPGFQTYEEPITSDFGDIDFVTMGPSGLHVAIEWETGNISSSHRSVNKLAIALITGKIHVGVLIVPSRNTYPHLTDRIGNIGELSGYLTMWKDLEPCVRRGALIISIVEHDDLTDDVNFPYLPVGKDGNAQKGKAKRNIEDPEADAVQRNTTGSTKRKRRGKANQAQLFSGE